jgi:hypothetical protein
VKYSKILIFLGICCVAGLLLVFGVRLQAQNKTKVESIAVNTNEMQPRAAQRMEQFRNRQQGSNLETQLPQQASRWGGQQRSTSSDSKDSSDFYKVIVDNNIFRPLGWRPPNREPQYTLIGTAINPNGTRVEAFISEERSNDFYIVGVGDKVGDAIVKEIQQKKVTLDKNGETITLRKGNMQFLKSGGSRRSSPSRSESSNRDESNNKGGSSKSFDKEAAMRKAKEEAMKKAQEMRGKFKGVPPEHREQIIRQLKERGILKGNSKVIVTFD